MRAVPPPPPSVVGRGGRGEGRGGGRGGGRGDGRGRGRGDGKRPDYGFAGGGGGGKGSRGRFAGPRLSNAIRGAETKVYEEGYFDPAELSE
mmetsp:Transcript_726/g.2375  ORF Transcript_726/g.2375 Transcript_726/m.2375 type:complete len:91 (+) Transcript_726:32-304(+)